MEPLSYSVSFSLYSAVGSDNISSCTPLVGMDPGVKATSLLKLATCGAYSIWKGWFRAFWSLQKALRLLSSLGNSMLAPLCNGNGSSSHLNSISVLITSSFWGYLCTRNSLYFCSTYGLFLKYSSLLFIILVRFCLSGWLSSSILSTCLGGMYCFRYSGTSLWDCSILFWLTIFINSLKC